MANRFVVRLNPKADNTRPTRWGDGLYRSATPTSSKSQSALVIESASAGVAPGFSGLNVERARSLLGYEPTPLIMGLRLLLATRC